MSYPPTSTISESTKTEISTMNPMSFSLKSLLSLSFFLLGLLNNVLYVVILSAALDLVTNAPKGLILLANIFPSLLVKLFWAYLVVGEVRYARRIIICSILSFVGIIVVAMSSTLSFRLFGISIASFSSGLGEMTYLSLSTLYTPSSSTIQGSPNEKRPLSLSSTALGWFASGTGAAGLVGAGAWWCLRSLGVREGLLICSFLPLCMAATFFLLLPKQSAFIEESKAIYSSIPDFEITEDVDEEEIAETLPLGSSSIEPPTKLGKIKEDSINLTTSEKFLLASPLVFKFMMPLFFVYLAEYTINTGVAPTLIYAIPSLDSPFLSSIIKSLRDYYPLWQLIYQTFVFLSRSSLTVFHLPPLPMKLLPLPTIIQLIILTLTVLESSTGFLQEILGFSEDTSIIVVAILIAFEGLCGGAAYVNVFYRLGLDIPLDSSTSSTSSLPTSISNEEGEARKVKEREFRIASVGFADTLGILVASLVSMILEPILCDVQVSRGRNYCKLE